MRKTRAGTAAISSNLRRERRRTDLGNAFADEVLTKPGRRKPPVKARMDDSASTDGNPNNNQQSLKSPRMASAKVSSGPRKPYRAMRDCKFQRAARSLHLTRRTMLGRPAWGSVPTHGGHSSTCGACQLHALAGWTSAH